LQVDFTHVIDSGKVEARVERQDGCESECASLPIINVELPNEFTRLGEFDDFAWLGRIDKADPSVTKWNDPAMASLNRGVKLPDMAIAFVHRSDGSGTTFIWTNYLLFMGNQSA